MPESKELNRFDVRVIRSLIVILGILIPVVFIVTYVNRTFVTVELLEKEKAASREYMDKGFEGAREYSDSKVAQILIELRGVATTQLQLLKSVDTIENRTWDMRPAIVQPAVLSAPRRQPVSQGGE